ncbi:hypothetical protein VTK26DRAFT_4546 [Humicola hyalothermophila]
MDVAHTQQSHRRKHRSFNADHLSLAPLTTRLPLRNDDYDAMNSTTTYSPPPHTTSYLQGKSAPTTPRLLSHSPVRIRSSSRHSRGIPASGHDPFDANGNAIPKSKSTTHLARRSHNHNRRSSRQHHNDSVGSSTSEFSEWLLRAGAAISTEARESKGQGWLVARDSSTSLAAAHMPSENQSEYGHADGYSSDEGSELEIKTWAQRRQRAHRGAANGSRRNSGGNGDGTGYLSSPPASRFGSRYGSRVHSRTASRVGGLTPGERQSMGDAQDYFGDALAAADGDGPDFVNLDDRLEAMGLVLEDLNAAEAEDDEAHVRRLMKQSNSSMISWIGSMFGLGNLPSVEEDDDESDIGDDAGGDLLTPGSGGTDCNSSTTGNNGRPKSKLMRIDGVTRQLREEPVNVPPPSEEGGWRDAAWLLSVAAKVLF